MTNFNEIPDLVSEQWWKYARAKAKFNMLSESKKSVLAKEASGHEWSESTRTRLALKSDVYREYLVAVQIAEQNQLELKYQIDALVMQFDYYRSTNSLKKKEINML